MIQIISNHTNSSQAQFQKLEATLDRLKIGMPERHFLPLMFGPLRVLFDDFSDDEKQQLVVQLKRLGLKVDAAATHRRVERGP